ncbi:hypothetical protein MHBO_003439, partial [Bonamia ostreae]
MSKIKLINEIDITCNIAFLDICTDVTQFYLLCCTGHQYPNYPCFGSTETGYAQHSSICRAALNSGVKCGQQFFAFYVGESCRFDASSNNNSNSFAYEEWSKAFKIKEVKELFSEHSRLKQTVDELNKDKSVNEEKIRNLEFELEGYLMEKETAEALSDQINNKMRTAQNEIKVLKRKNTELGEDLKEAKKYPKEEFEKLKDERKVFLRRLGTAQTEKIELKSENAALKAKLAIFAKKKKIEKEENLLKTKLLNFEKELLTYQVSSGFHDLGQMAEKTIKEFCGEKESQNETGKKDNAISDMKKIFSVLGSLQIDVQNLDLELILDKNRKFYGISLVKFIFVKSD